MVADRVDEGAEALRLAQAAILAQDGEDACEGLLAHVLNGLRGAQAGAELDLEQCRKVADKMLLRRAVACTESFNVTCIEAMKLQGWLRGPERKRV